MMFDISQFDSYREDNRMEVSGLAAVCRISLLYGVKKGGKNQWLRSSSIRTERF